MSSQEIMLLVTFILSMIGIIFSVYHFFKNPQIDIDKKQALSDEREKNKAERTEFSVLKTQFEMVCKNNDEKFIKIEKQIKEAFTIANNHTNETDSKVTSLVAEVGSLRNEITRLTTTIEERIPKKN